VIPKPLSEIAESDLLDLTTNKVAEGTLLEYKSVLPGPTDGDKIKFLRAVSSFANTQGGDLIYGVQASQGVPTAIPGFAGVNEDGERLRLENLCRDGIQERIRNIQMRFVSLASGSAALVIRVPRSWNGPHRVVLGGHGHFYARNSAGSYQMDVPQLRSAFLLSQSVADRIRDFREQRLAQIGANAGPVPLDDGALAVFHVVPLLAFTEPMGWGRLQLSRREAYAFGPIDGSARTARNNFDGYCMYSGSDEKATQYSQVFRSGMVEYVIAYNYVDEQSKKPLLFGSWIEDMCLGATETFCAALAKHGINPPYYLMLSLLRVKDFTFDTGDWALNRKDRTSDRDSMFFPEVTAEEPSVDAPPLLQPVFDLLFQGFGHEHSNSYDDKGNFARKRRR
jgi:hypothetical protein